MHDATMVCVGGAGKGAGYGDRYRDNCLRNTILSTETQVLTPRYGQYRRHAHNHITPVVVAAMENCFFVIRTHKHGIAPDHADEPKKGRNSCPWLPPLPVNTTRVIWLCACVYITWFE